jgi:hypothetical protein
MNQGKRDDQLAFSMKCFIGGLIGIVAILLFSLIAVVVNSIFQLGLDSI